MLPDILKPTENACLNTSDDHAPLILVVEDHEDTRSLYRFVLESRNFLVAIAVDGEQAVKLAKEKKPHLILMDTNLPGMDGVMAAREIREFDGDGHIPIIFVSGDAQPELKLKAIKAGGDEYLVKPINLDDLNKAIERQLELRSRNRSDIVGN